MNGSCQGSIPCIGDIALVLYMQVGEVDTDQQHENTGMDNIKEWGN